MKHRMALWEAGPRTETVQKQWPVPNILQRTFKSSAPLADNQALSFVPRKLCDRPTKRLVPDRAVMNFTSVGLQTLSFHYSPVVQPHHRHRPPTLE